MPIRQIATRRVPHVEQDLLTLPEHLRPPLVFGGVRVAYSPLIFNAFPSVLVCYPDFVFYPWIYEFWTAVYCCLYLFYSFLCCVMCTIVCLFIFFILSHGVVSLFSIYEFDCSAGIFRPFFSNHKKPLNNRLLGDLGQADEVCGGGWAILYSNSF